MEVGHGCKRGKGFLKLEEAFGKGQFAGRVNQSSGGTRFEVEIKQKEARAQMSSGSAVSEVWEASVKV